MGSLKNFHYLGRLADGKPARGELWAETANEARMELERRGIHIEFLRPASARVAGRRDPEFVTAFTGRLALLLRAGISLTAALEMLARQEGKASRRAVLESMLQGLDQGRYLHEILGDHEILFDDPFRQMVRAGELAGDLPSVLEALAASRRQNQQVRSRTVSALIYPALVLLVAFSAILFLCGHVLPHFQNLYRSQQLPTLTASVLSLGQFLHRYGMTLLIILLLSLCALILYGRTSGGQRFLSQLLFRIPLLGPLLLHQCLILFLRTFSLSLHHGIPYDRAFSLACSVVPGTSLRSRLQAIGDRSCEGVPLVEILACGTLFPAAVAGLLAAGESAGNLAAMASHAADLLDEELTLALEQLAAVLRPLVILLLAALVGWIAVALFLPIVQLQSFI